MNTKDLKKTQTLRVQLSELGELQVFSRRGRPDFSKRMVDAVTADGQKLYGEVRNSMIPVLNHFKVGDIVEIDYFFAGSEKDGKKYNNIIIVNLQRV